RAGRPARGAAHAPRAGLELCRNRCEARHPRQCGKDPRVQGDAQVEGTVPRMTTPEHLRSLIPRDLKRARPLRSPAVRALIVGPLAMATVVAVPLATFFRSDMAELGLLRGWGLSFVESLAGVIVVGLALCESIPGRALSRVSLVSAFVL